MNTPAQEITTILGQGSSFDGKLTFEGAVRIDGAFSGEIHTEGTLVIGQTAEVRAQIVAARVVVQGTVRGDVSATESIQVLAPARIYGTLSTPELEIQRGALFEGSCHMESGAQVVQDAALAAAEVAAAPPGVAEA